MGARVVDHVERPTAVDGTHHRFPTSDLAPVARLERGRRNRSTQASGAPEELLGECRRVPPRPTARGGAAGPPRRSRTRPGVARRPGTVPRDSSSRAGPRRGAHSGRVRDFTSLARISSLGMASAHAPLLSTRLRLVWKPSSCRRGRDIDEPRVDGPGGIPHCTLVEHLAGAPWARWSCRVRTVEVLVTRPEVHAEHVRGRVRLRHRGFEAEAGPSPAQADRGRAEPRVPAERTLVVAICVVSGPSACTSPERARVVADDRLDDRRREARLPVMGDDDDRFWPGSTSIRSRGRRAVDGSASPNDTLTRCGPREPRWMRVGHQRRH